MFKPLLPSDKKIKGYRKPYIDSRAVDSRCRCHGGCPWCLGNRMYKYQKQKDKADYSLKEEC